MSVATTQPTRSILVTMATRYGMEPAAFEATVRATCMPTGNNQQPATREEFAAFLLVANEHRLNPLTKEIYAYPKRGGGIQPIVSIDGWVRMINERPELDGIEFDETIDEKGNLIANTCSIWRKDRSRPVRITEILSECVRPTEPWKMKHRMLRHKALIQCSRIAFGFAGIMDPDEAEKIIDITPQAANAPARPQRSDFASTAQTTTQYPVVTILDESGEVAGEWPAPRAIAMLGGLVRGKSHDIVIAVVEHNQDAMGVMEQANIAVGEIEEIYQAAVNAKREELAKTAQPAQAEQKQAQQPAGDVGFWQRDSLEITPTAIGKGHDWNAWKREFLQRLSEAASKADVTALERWNEDHIAALSLKYMQTGEEVKKAVNARLAELDAAEG